MIGHPSCIVEGCRQAMRVIRRVERFFAMQGKAVKEDYRLDRSQNHVKTGEPGRVSTRILRLRNPGAHTARLTSVLHSCHFLDKNTSQRCMWWLCVAVCVLTSQLALAQSSSDTKGEPSYKLHVEPLLKEKCWKCHGPDTQKSELALHTAELIQKGGESGPVIVPGNSGSSRLFEVIKHGEMPPDQQGTLTSVEVELIGRWIDTGASFGTDAGDGSRKVTQHDVIPILLLRCTACHGRQKQEGELDLRNRDSILKGGMSGPAIVLGKPDESLLIKRVRAEEMPPHRRLTEASVKPMEPEELKTLTRWIELGAPLAPVEPDLAGTPADPLVRPEDKNFWSFRAPKNVSIPKLAKPSRVERGLPLQNGVDAFIADKLDQKGLPLTETADRTTLMRRVTFDLTGLPPSPAEVIDFQNDQSPDAFEKVVDRLLASVRYGERWGRHWLDVAGYAECEGRREQHLPRPFAWRYRDYVIRSLNADKPFDRFLIEQIAGDELTDYENATTITKEMEDNLVATAFLRMAPDPTWANLTGYVPDRLEVMADSLDVLGSGVLGLTLKCARCHTHKFDPIPQRDYYRLAAIFKGAYDEHDWLKPQLIPYGGALSAGFGERLLPYVSSEERRPWEEHQSEIQRQIDELAKLPKTPEIEKQIKDLESKKVPEPQIMALWDRGDPSPAYLYRRGNYATPGSVVLPGVPAVLSGETKRFEIIPPRPGAKSTGRRLALARWLTDPQHPLTARVMVNRIWKHHFGQGIVRSLGNFGKTGDRPTHPELLDFLSRDFIRREWSTKSLHRQLVSSATYRQQSQVGELASKLDPANVLLSRMPLQRLDAEQLRDAILFVADQLNEFGGGPSESIQLRSDGLVQTGRRRSVYVQQLRKHPASLLETFDLPSMNPNCIQRSDSLVPTQALHLRNDTAVRKLAEQFARRILQNDNPRSETSTNDSDRQIEQAYWIALGHAPTAEERTYCKATRKRLTSAWQYQKSQSPEGQAIDPSIKALTTICHTILNSADFLYVD